MPTGLTVKELCALTGVPLSSVAYWLKVGVVSPDFKGSRHGSSMRFGTMQSVGVMVGATLSLSDRGCTPRYFKKVVKAFSSMQEHELHRLLGNGNTHFAMLDRDGPVLLPPQADWPDVKAAFDKVSAKVMEE